MIAVLFFLLTFATVAALVWGAMELLTVEENPLADRLQELQSSAMVSSVSRTPRRTGRGGFLNWLLYAISLIPGGEDWPFARPRRAVRPPGRPRHRDAKE